jgi:hypothetical protein
VEGIKASLMGRWCLRCTISGFKIYGARRSSLKEGTGKKRNRNLGSVIPYLEKYKKYAVGMGMWLKW